MQNCVQPPFSPNHFYAFDQFNLLKLQQTNYSNAKRKYSDLYDHDEPEYISTEDDFDQTPPPSPPLRNQITSPLKTADHIRIDKYHDQIETPVAVDEKPESEIILLRLEKILNLCGELRSLASDIENHLHEKQPNSSEIHEKSPVKKNESEQTLIDIYKELEYQQTIKDIEEKNAPPPYQTANDDTLSIHSESIKSHPLMVCRRQ